VTQYSQGLAGRAMFPQRETTNPSLAAKALLGIRGAVRRVGSVYKGGLAGRGLRAFRRRRTHNPALAALAPVAGLAGGLKLGQRVDPKKHAARMAVVDHQAQLAAKGDEQALANLEGIATGRQWPGQWADVAARAAQQFEQIAPKFEAKSAAAAARAAKAEARESRFLQAGTDIAGTLGSALLSRGRSVRRPRRKRRRPSF